MNERERTVDRRLAALETKVFGKPQGAGGDSPGRQAQKPRGPAPWSAKRTNEERVAEVRQGAGGSGRVNLNTATAKEIRALDGIGPAGAKRIIAHRKDKPFESVDELSRVGGIAQKVIDKVRPHVTV